MINKRCEILPFYDDKEFLFNAPELQIIWYYMVQKYLLSEK